MRIQEALKKFLKEDTTHRKQHCEWSELQRSVDAKIEVAFTFHATAFYRASWILSDWHSK